MRRPGAPLNAAATSALLVATSLLVMVPALTPGSTTDQVTVVYPPWWNAARAASAATTASQIVAPGRVPFVLVVHAPSQGALARLRAGGALLLLNLGAVACAPPKDAR